MKFEIFVLQCLSVILSFIEIPLPMRLLNTRDINLQPKCILIVAASMYQTDKTLKTNLDYETKGDTCLRFTHLHTYTHTYINQCEYYQCNGTETPTFCN